MFLQQKIVYESRLEKYRNTMTLFVTNVEENIEQNIDEVSKIQKRRSEHREWSTVAIVIVCYLT